MTSSEALSRLPGLYQAIGKLAMMAKRCKPKSKKALAYWQMYADFGNQAAELSSLIRMQLLSVDACRGLALHHAQDGGELGQQARHVLQALQNS